VGYLRLGVAVESSISISAPPVWNRQFHRTFLNAHPERSTEEIMPKEAHEEAAKHHENAAKSHKTAAEHHGKGDTASAAKHSAEAHGHSTKAHESSTKAHGKSTSQK
jgi:hypothetical protein